MASGANVKIGVTGVSQFKSDISKAEQAVKTFSAQLALCEKEFKNTGKQEDYLVMKTNLLKGKLEAEEKTVKELEKALEGMRKNGVDRASTSYQTMYRKMLSAKGAVSDTKTEITKLTSSEETAGKKTDSLSNKLKKIGDGVAWDNVAEGIGKITSKLESGARAAVNFGKKVLNAAKGSTGYADEIKTAVDQYSDMGLTADSYQRMSKVAEFVDTPVEAILNARQRMNAALAKDKGKKSLEETLGIKLQGQTGEDLFWETGEALMHMGEGFDKEAAAQTLFGRSWRELAPLFKTGREEYEKMLGEQTVLTDDQVEALGKADDAIKSVEQEIEMLKHQFWAENADTITSILEWLVDHKEAVVTAIGAIGVALAGLKIAEFAASVGQAVNGIKMLMGAGGAGTAGAAGASGAASAAGGGTAGTAAAAGGGSGLLAKLSAHLGPAGVVAGTSAAMFFGLERAYNEREWGAFNRNEAANAGKENPLMASLASSIHGETDWENVLREHADELRALTPDNPLWDLIGNFADLSDGLQQTEIDDMLSNWFEYGMKGEDITEMFKDAYNRMSEATEELTGKTEAQAQSNSEMAQAAQGLQGLPAEIVNGISGLIGSMGVTIDGQALIGWVNAAQAGMVTQ